jgi:putative membrane protein
MPFLTEGAQKALRETIGAIERGTSAEVVVAVRARLRRWPSANAAVGVLVAIVALAFTLWAETEFELYEILLVPVLGGMAGGLAVELVAPLQRALTPRPVIAHDLREASRAAFYELGVHKTRGRTGVLVFVAVRERVAALVGDVEVVKQVGQPQLDKMAKAIAAAIPEGGVAMAKALGAIDGELAKALPRMADDIDELPNMVHVMRPHRRGRAVGG